MILQPNCSSLVIRLGPGDMRTISTDGYPNGAIDMFWDIVDEDYDVTSLEVTNEGGDFGYIERLVEFIKACKRYKIPRETAEKIDNDLMWGSDGKWEAHLYKHLDNKNRWHNEELPVEKRNEKLGQKLVMERL